MENTRLCLVIFVNLVFLNLFIDYGVCKKFRMDDEPDQSIDRIERATRAPDYRDEGFEGKRESSWSGKSDPDPNTKVDEVDCDGEWDDLAFEESVKFALDKESCELNILGSKAEKCSAEIVCTDLNFKEPIGKKCQLDSYIKITDALGGSLTACGKADFGGPYRASKNGRDLYIKYKGPSNGTICQVICGQDRETPEYEPIMKDVIKRNREPSCVCGIKPEMQGRIVGGNHATPYEFPWLAALAYKGARMQFCGGSLINSKYILSAAHCFHDTGIGPKELDILLHAHVLDLNTNQAYNSLPPGSNPPSGQPGSLMDVPGLNERNYTDAEEETVRLEVEAIYVHPLWNFKTLDYDIALIQLKESLDLKDTRLYNPVCLPPEGQYFGYANKTATVAGWGKPHETAGAASRILQKASMPVLFTKTCKRLLDSDSRNMTARMLCAGWIEGGIDSCVGDSGGPLTFKFNDEQHRQIGVVSFGVGCARKANPGVYTQIQEAIQWIFHMTDDATWCQENTRPKPSTPAGPEPVEDTETNSGPIHVITTPMPFEDI